MKKLGSALFIYGIFFCVIVGSIVWTAKHVSASAHTTITSELPRKKITKKDLSEYNDSGKHQQILLAYEGSVYDVTEGKEFYGKGGPYHFLAGTDATAMLHIAGGDIVKRKYPIIGILSL